MGPITDEVYFKNLKNLVSDLNCKKNVEFVGPIPNNNMNSIYNSSKLFLFTSKHEGQPGVILEAMACGLPILSTPIGIVPKLIHEGKNGFIIEKNNPKIIAEKISLLLSNEKLRKKIAIASRETMEIEYSLENFTDNLICYFKKSLDI